MSFLSRLATRMYALTLRAFPRAHRRRYGHEIVDAFEREMSARHNRDGVLRAIAFAFEAYLDAILAGMRERRRSRSGLPRPRPLDGTLQAWYRDVVYACRSLARAKTYTLVCVLSLAVGIGSNVGMVLFLRSMWAPAEGVAAEGLLELVLTPRGAAIAELGGPSDRWSYPDFVDLRDGGTGIDVTAWSLGLASLRANETDGSVRVRTLWVADDYLETVGVAPVLGRDFTEADAWPSAPPVAIVGWDLWQNRLAGRDDVVGSPLVINRVEHTVIGVAPKAFRGHRTSDGGSPADLWLPLHEHPVLAAGDGAARDRSRRWVNLLAKAPPGVGLKQANAALATVMARLESEYPTTNRDKGIQAFEYAGFPALMRGEFLVIRTLMLVGAGLVLLVVCMNLAGMALVRSAERERELAVRLAIGSSRGGLVRALMSESLVISLVSGFVAVVGIFGGLRFAAYRMGETLPSAADPSLGLFAVCAALALLATLASGLWPALRFSRPGLYSALRCDAGGAGKRRTGQVHRLAAAIQTGFAVPFLVIGFIYLSHSRTALFDLGFEPEGLYAVPLDPLAEGYSKEAAETFVHAVSQNVRGMGGVESVGLGGGLPLDGERRPLLATKVTEPARVTVHSTRVSEGYLTGIGARLLVGRDIEAGDRAGSEPVAVLSESAVKELWPDGDALGERLMLGERAGATESYRVVGVAADVAGPNAADPREAVYLSLAQHPGGQVYVVARATGDPAVIVDGLRKTVTSLDRDLIRPAVVTATERVDSEVRGYLFQSLLSGLFSLIALLLAALGVYGIIAFMVAARTREMGVRMAIGASRSQVIGEVLGDSVRLVAPGVLLGCALLAAFLWSKTGIPQADLVVTVAANAGAIGVVLTIVVLASLGPALRAAGVQPVEAMRAD